MFETLQAYYNYLEQDRDLKIDERISKSILKLRDQSDAEDIMTACSYEMFFTDYHFSEGQLKPHLTFTDNSTYPNLSLFKDDFKYIRLRAESVQNPKYKARYYHLLWCSPSKRLDYAKKAIDSYFDIINSSSPPENDPYAHIIFENLIKNLFILAQSVNYKKIESFRLIGTIIDCSSLHDYRKISLIEFIQREGKKVPPATLQLFFNHCKIFAEKHNSSDFIDNYLRLLISLCSRVNISPKTYYDQLGDYYKMQGESRENFVAQDFYIKALSAYQQSGNKGKMEDTSVLIEKSKRDLEFKSVGIEHNSEMLQQWAQKISSMTDKLTNDYSSKGIYEYIILYEHLFPKADALNDNARPVIFDYITVMSYDLNKNVNKKNPAGLNAYELHIQNFTLHHLHQIFYKGIKNGKISSDTLLDYLKKYSWFAVKEEQDEFDWIGMLSPAIAYFFNQSEIDIKEKTNSENGYVLCIDSIVLKFEGILRDFSRKIGAQTIEIKEGGTQERISFEKLLDNPKLIDIIPADDLALFKFLFFPEHMNLRNNIAHCFYRTNQYSAGLMFLLIAALIKLGNYKLSC